MQAMATRGAGARSGNSPDGYLSLRKSSERSAPFCCEMPVEGLLTLSLEQESSSKLRRKMLSCSSRESCTKELSTIKSLICALLGQYQIAQWKCTSNEAVACSDNQETIKYMTSYHSTLSGQCQALII